MTWRQMLAALSGLLILLPSGRADAARGCDSPPALLFVLRHAEKAKRPAKNPPLTTQGRERARALVDALDGVSVAAIYATEYKRTQQTVAPLARARGLEIDVIKSSQTRRLVRMLRCRHSGQVVVVVGHSFTLPTLLRRLGIDEKVQISEGAYGEIYVVTYDAAGRATLDRRHFGT